jgi:hypothetical protein
MKDKDMKDKENPTYNCRRWYLELDADIRRQPSLYFSQSFPRKPRTLLPFYYQVAHPALGCLGLIVFSFSIFLSDRPWSKPHKNVTSRL